MHRLLAALFVARALASCTWLQNVHTDAGCCSQLPSPSKPSICELTSDANIWDHLLSASPGVVNGRVEFESLSVDIAVSGSASTSVMVGTSYSTAVTANTTTRAVQAGSVYDRSVVLGSANYSKVVLGDYSDVIVVGGLRYRQQPVRIDDVTVLAHVLVPDMTTGYQSPCDSTRVSAVSGQCADNVGVVCLDSQTAVVQVYMADCAAVSHTLVVTPGKCYPHDMSLHAGFPGSFIIRCD
jgi:hypothetical protein